jgi:hypothetical protein
MKTDIHPTQTKRVESTPWMRERDFYIDCLRSAMIALVILHHTAITYGASGLWFYREQSFSGTPSSLILELFGATNQAYYMGFLFLLAGYFTPGSLERKGYARFLSDRFLRLGLPLLAFGLILGPLTVAVVSAAEGQGFWSTFVRLWNHRQFVNGPLWFVQALLIFSLAYCAWRAWFGARLSGAQRAPRPIPSYGWWLLSAFGVGAAALAIRQVVPVGVTVMGMQLGYFASYIFLFSLGIAAWRYDWFRQLEWNHARDWITALVIAWLSFPAVRALAIALNGPGTSNYTGGLNWMAIALVKFAVTGILACTTCWILADPLVRAPGLRRIV